MERSSIDDELQAELCADFSGVLVRKYRYYCDRHREKPSMEGLVAYCIAAGVIRQRTVAHYMVMELYPGALYRNLSAQDAYMEISAETGLSERTVRRMAKRQCRYSAEKKSS